MSPRAANCKNSSARICYLPIPFARALALCIGIDAVLNLTARKNATAKITAIPQTAAKGPARSTLAPDAVAAQNTIVVRAASVQIEISGKEPRHASIASDAAAVQ